MLAKENTPFCVSTLTNFAKNLLLTNNTLFRPEYFCFVDPEVNYLLFNDDNLFQKGFDHVDSTTPDTISDIDSLVIRDPNPKFDGTSVSYIFGDVVPHQLKETQVLQEADLVVDMTADAIEKKTEILATQIQRKTEITFQIISGSFSPYTLTDSQLHSWATMIDIRAHVTLYDIDGSITILDESSSASLF